MPETQLQSPPSKDQQKPHWIQELLFDPKHPFQNGLQPGEDYPQDALYDKALGSFDPRTLGQVPTWFPRRLPDGGRYLSPQERLTWFDKALQHYAPKEWPPKGSLNSMQQQIAQSLLHMQSVVGREELPTPDKL